MLKKFLINISNIRYISLIKQIYFKIKKNRSFIEFILLKKYNVVLKNKKIFSLRDFGGSTKERGKRFYTKEVKTVDWINNFEENSNFLDIGANIGIYSLYAGKLNHKVLSIEPESLNFTLLNLNIFDNKLGDNIIAYPFSAYSENSINTLNIYNMFWGKSGHQFKHDFPELKKNATNYHLQGSYGIKIDTLIEQTNFLPKYVKIDVDGLENEVIKGMQNTLSRNIVKSILIEIDDDNQFSQEIFLSMKNNGYTVSDSEIVGKKTSNYIFKK